MGNGQTLRGEDKGEGGITTLPIADCYLIIGKKQYNLRFLNLEM